MALFTIVGKLTLIRASIGPPEDSTSMHFIAKPFTIIIPPVRPSVLAMALDVVLSELSDVAGSIMPVEVPMAMLCAIDVGALIACLVRPRLDSLPVLLVFLPAAFVDGTVVVHVLAVTVGFVVEPLALVDVSIRMDQTTNTIGFALAPLALVQRAIEPDLATLAGSRFQISLPLSDVDGPAGQLVWSFRHIRFSVCCQIRNLKRTLLFEDLLDSFVSE